MRSTLHDTRGSQPAIAIRENRFSRLEAIDWWDQALLQRSRVLVIGAGALGNEIIKNLALLGVGHLVIVDMDRVELSNLSRSALFRESDEGHLKAECAARAAQNIFNGIEARPLAANVLAEVGLGYFRWADVVMGALDNREARVFVNSACARVGRVWFDGGIEVLQGVVRGFAPPITACYECTMSKVDWELVNQRRSCSLLARRAVQNLGAPTTPTTASVIGAMQVQEVIKHLHGRKALLGEGFVFEGLEHASYRTTYRMNPECPWHETQPPIRSMPEFNSATALDEIWRAATAILGEVDAIDLGRELVERMECPACGIKVEVLQAVEKIREDQLICPKCKTEAAPVFIHSIPAGSNLLKKTLAGIGLPKWDILWARRGTEFVGFEVSGDSIFGGGSEER